MGACVTPSAVKKLLRFLPSSNTVSVPITGFTFPFVHRVPEHVLYHFLYNDFRGAQKIPFVVCAFARLINFSFFLNLSIQQVFYLFIYCKCCNFGTFIGVTFALYITYIIFTVVRLREST